MHMNNVGTDTIEEILRVGNYDQYSLVAENKNKINNSRCKEFHVYRQQWFGISSRKRIYTDIINIKLGTQIHVSSRDRHRQTKMKYGERIIADGFSEFLR